jgi:hypothetical protein
MAPEMGLNLLGAKFHAPYESESAAGGDPHCGLPEP